jgi:hypothetical protein
MSLEPLWKSLGDDGFVPAPEPDIRTVRAVARLTVAFTATYDGEDGEEAAVEAVLKDLSESIPASGATYEAGEVVAEEVTYEALEGERGKCGPS